jgi:hypothetical protein
MNTLIDNLLNFNTTNENNKATNMTVEHTGPSSVSIEKTIPSLYQGDRFIKYQDKIKKNVEKNLGNNGNNIIKHDKLGKSVKSTENFTTNTTNQNNENAERLKQEYNQILSQYNETLNKYNALTNKIQKNSSNFIDRTDPNNKYLNKFIQFTRTGHLLYVTKQGVAKYIPNMDILNSISGKNGCPTISGSNKYIPIDIPWLNEYSIEGTQLPTNPPLIIGKNMQLNESCGHEGSNVFVNKMMSTTPTPTYVGCYQENEASPAMTIIGNKRVFSTKNMFTNGDFSQPVIANNSYQYINSGTRVPGWWFNAVLINNSNDWGYPMPYPNGNQSACIQATQSISQSIDLESEVTYTLVFDACGRDCCDSSKLSNPINVQLYTAADNKFISTIYNFQPPVSKWTTYTKNFTVENSQKYKVYFSGTWAAGDRSTAIKNIRLTSSSSGTYNVERCEEAAILGGYQYFALQNSDPSSGLGFCAVGNDINSIKKNGPGYTFVPLWSSNTAGKPTTYAVVTKNGTLTVCDSNGTAHYTSPNGTNCDQVYSSTPNTDAGGNDLSYQTNQTVDSCKTVCDNTPNCNGFAFNTGTNNSCWIKTGTLSNTSNNNQRTLYKKTVDTSKCNYFLALQGDGNMCVYKGEPNKNLGGVWCTMTNGKQQIPNVNYSLAKSKYGMSFLKMGQILNKGDWVVSDDGKLLLIMQNDGNLVLYTFKSSCVAGSGNNSKNYYGGDLANALYDIGSVGIKSNMGQVAYIDADSQIHPYSSANVGYANTYSSVFQNTNIQGNDIPGAAVSNVSDVNKCMAICNRYKNCNAFVYDTTGPSPICYPKNIPSSDVYSIKNFKSGAGKTMYIRDKKPINNPAGIDNSVNNVDSITYKNYGNKGGELQNSYLFTTINSVQKQELSQMRDKLNLLTSQVNNKIERLHESNINMIDDIKLEFIKQANWVEGIEGFEGLEGLNNNSYFKTIQTHTKIKKIQKNDPEINNILRDSNIKTLQQNYSYMLWSILAIGVTMIAIRVKNT